MVYDPTKMLPPVPKAKAQPKPKQCAKTIQLCPSCGSGRLIKDPAAGWGVRVCSKCGCRKLQLKRPETLQMTSVL